MLLNFSQLFVSIHDEIQIYRTNFPFFTKALKLSKKGIEYFFITLCKTNKMTQKLSNLNICLGYWNENSDSCLLIFHILSMQQRSEFCLFWHFKKCHSSHKTEFFVVDQFFCRWSLYMPRNLIKHNTPYFNNCDKLILLHTLAKRW